MVISRLHNRFVLPESRHLHRLAILTRTLGSQALPTRAHRSSLTLATWQLGLENMKSSTFVTMTSSWAWWISNHRRLECLLNRLFRRRSKKTPKRRVTGFCEETSSVTGEFPSQRASNAENVSIWWLHHVDPGWFEHERCYDNIDDRVTQWTHYV